MSETKEGRPCGDAEGSGEFDQEQDEPVLEWESGKSGVNYPCYQVARLQVIQYTRRTFNSNTKIKDMATANQWITNCRARHPDDHFVRSWSSQTKSGQSCL